MRHAHAAAHASELGLDLAASYDERAGYFELVVRVEGAADAFVGFDDVGAGLFSCCCYCLSLLAVDDGLTRGAATSATSTCSVTTTTVVRHEMPSMIEAATPRRRQQGIVDER